MSYKDSYYYRKTQELKQKIKEIYGEECHLCKSKKSIQLHHMYYASDSIRPKTHNENGSRSLMRKQESVDHPERFLLVCLSCHNKIEPRLPLLKIQRKKRMEC